MTEPTSGTRIVAISTLASTVSVLPVWMVAALGVLIGYDITMTESQFGMAISAYFGAAAIVSVPGGWLAQNFGAGRLMTVSLVASASSLIGIATTASSWWHLSGMLALAGVGGGIVQPATDLGIAQGLGPDSRRRGAAFGLKMASVPLGTLIAGVAVPTIGLTLGWRPAIALACILAVAVLVAVPRRQLASRHRRPSGRRPKIAASPLVALGIAGTVAATTATALTAFYVLSATDSGIATSTAGHLLALGSVCGLIGRIGWGVAVDRAGRDGLAALAALLVIGGVGIALLGAARGPGMLATVTIIAFGAGWAWNGLFSYAVVLTNPDAPAVASGMSMLGIRVGGIIGPAGFGFLLERSSFAFTWMVAGALLVLAGAIIWLARPWARASQVTTTGRIGAEIEAIDDREV